MKCVGLGHALLQYFVDEVQSLKSRTDSHMLLTKARQMRVDLKQQGFLESDLPNLEGQNVSTGSHDGGHNILFQYMQRVYNSKFLGGRCCADAECRSPTYFDS